MKEQFTKRIKSESGLTSVCFMKVLSST
jgi:hypothetical protein